MKILFLDIDGVGLPFNPPNRDVAYGCFKNVNRLCLQSPCKVVVSSSWRWDAINATGDWKTAHTHVEWIGKQNWLQNVMGLNVEIIGVTPFLGKQGPRVVEPGVRGEEILAWLAEHPEVTNWVAIDDFPEWLGPKVAHRLVAVEGNYSGFTEENVEQALRLFGHES